MASANAAAADMERSRVPCAAIVEEDGVERNCRGRAGLLCTECHLVQWCSQECRLSHLPEHEKDCKSELASDQWRPEWVKENREPVFHGRELKHVPALDVLSLSENEGADYARRLAVSFAAAGDIRNIVHTVNALPASFNNIVNIHINHWDIDVVTRNITLLILALTDPEDTEDVGDVLDCMIHVWYSAFLTPKHRDLIKRLVLPRIQPAVDATRGYTDISKHQKTMWFGDEGCSLRIVLSGADWKPHRNRVVLAHKDDFQRALCYQPGASKAAVHKFRQTGVLLPFGSSQFEYVCPNPTLFREDGTWSAMDSADPREGYSFDEIVQYIVEGCPVPPNDEYGQSYVVLRDQLQKFRNRCRQSKISFDATCSRVSDLADHLTEYGPKRFDRIEVSNIMDPGSLHYVSIRQTLRTVGSLLCQINRHATVVSLFDYSVHVVQLRHEASITQELSSTVTTYLPVPRDLRESIYRYDPRMYRLIVAADLCSPWADWFDEFFQELRAEEDARNCGFNARDTNTIVTKFPWMFEGDRNDIEGSRTKLLRMLEGRLCGGECYVEWVRE
ncbi:uncharacterized protein AB675_10844 [Cyphellophora attinorum]|uniref:DUF4470 domain-containing protein n=1 Tax=Cyphellophora attinorum TaxID=1664694 RepID=A0A0N1HUW2_9EURO|nr:uncharacterized protein AB675_10844 [Phialophora attinorum]KPI40874.1 hypothetical protein AB675_10844 [Phialophora attinorum]